ncbi:MAG: alpha,2-mannosyltransferase [Chloroflexota bacterium]|jgi:alpha-1,2-mannosyltransferase|nr:alpha,2-mannosyltransferase [Chloroflexota bacterium]
MLRQPRVTPARILAGLGLLGALAWWLRTSARALDVYSGNSDFAVVITAGRRLWSGAAVYRPFDLSIGTAFQTGSSSISYPPSAFVVLAPWIALPDPWSGVTWLAVQWAALAAVIGAVYLAIGRPSVVEGAVAVAACLALYPVRDCLGEGQFGTVLVALAAVALLAHERGRPGVGGIALGLGIALKLNPVLVVPLFLYLRSYRLLGWALATVVVVCAVTLVVGWGPRWVEYLQLVGPLGRGTALSANQGLNGFLLRLWRPDLVGQPITDLPVWFRAAWYGGDLAIAAGAAWLVRRVGVDTPLGRWTALGIALTAVALVEPFAWVHHLVGLVLLVVVGARLIATRTPARWATAVVAGLVLFLAVGARYTVILPSEAGFDLPAPGITRSLVFAATVAVAGVVGGVLFQRALATAPAARLRSK